jgi:hypothetical protein
LAGFGFGFASNDTQIALFVILLSYTLRENEHVVERTLGLQHGIGKIKWSRVARGEDVGMRIKRKSTLIQGGGTGR